MKHGSVDAAGGGADPEPMWTQARFDVIDMHFHADGHVVPAVGFSGDGGLPPVAKARRLHAGGGGRLAALSRITAQYTGIASDDPRLEPYWAPAEELDIPVGIHLGPGPPGAAHFETPRYRVSAGDPLRLEPVLVRPPRPRVTAMHAGWPIGEATIAMLLAHPQLTVDVGVLDWAYGEKDFNAYGVARRDSRRGQADQASAFPVGAAEAADPPRQCGTVPAFAG